MMQKMWALLSKILLRRYPWQRERAVFHNLYAIYNSCVAQSRGSSCSDQSERHEAHQGNDDIL